MNRGIRAVTVLAFVGLAAAPLAAAPETPPAIDAQCAVPDELVTPQLPLERVAAQLRSGGPLRIVVVGTASSIGAGVSRPERAYPARLQQALRRRWPGRAVEVQNRSVAGHVAAQMADALPGLVAELKPVLVVWQTGTVDAIKGIDVNDFGDAVQRGIEAVNGAGVDLILMNAQYGSPSLQLRDMTIYLDYLDQLVRGRDAILFNRYEIMRHWADSGAVDFGQENRARQQAVADQVHDCVGQLLATMIVEAAR